MSVFSHCLDAIEFELVKEAISLGKVQQLVQQGAAKASPERLARFDKNMAAIKKKSFDKVWKQRGADVPSVRSSRGITDKVLVARDAAQGINTVGAKAAPSIPPSRGAAPTLVTQDMPSYIQPAPRGFVPDTSKAMPSSPKNTTHSKPTVRAMSDTLPQGAIPPKGTIAGPPPASGMNSKPTVPMGTPPPQSQLRPTMRSEGMVGPQRTMPAGTPPSSRKRMNGRAAALALGIPAGMMLASGDRE
jgi:hypothetical protein